MEFLREFIKEGYLKAVGKMEDYKIILGASAYFDKCILKEEDLKEISEAINKQYETTEKVEEIDSTENIEEETANAEEEE
nr:MAG TPA: hypothetical protein [Caudoviricetes sp.]